VAPGSREEDTPKQKMRQNKNAREESHVLVSDSLFMPRFSVGQDLFRINELLTLDRPGKLDSNRLDSEVEWGSSEACFTEVFWGS
jgi:hypothetical protein